MPEWLQVIRELGSFGLIAFVVWWYATHVAPTAEKQLLDVIERERTESLIAATNARNDYLKASADARHDYLDARNLDREASRELVAAMHSLADLTKAHVNEARTVWEARGDIKHRESKVS